MSQNPPRTPFDDPDNTGVPVPFSKNTQPLPPGGQANNSNSLLHGLQTGNSLNTPIQPPAQPTAPAPPAYVPVAPPPTPTVAPVHAPPAYPPRVAPIDTPAPKPKVPLPTIIGLAVTGGVLLAIAIPSMMRRAIPTVEMKEPPPAVAVAAPNLTPKPRPTLAVEAVPVEPGEGTSTEDGLAVGPDAPSDGGSVDEPQRGGNSRTSTTSTSSTSSRTPDSRGSSRDVNTPADDSQLPGAEDSSNDSSAAERSVDEGRARDIDDTPVPGESEPDRAASSPAASEGQSTSRDAAPSGVKSTRTQSAGYSISPPSGWLKGRNKSRATWSGPGGAQLLVEESGDISSSPREDWEKLDRSFRKKYGRRYRSLGIRESTLAGLPASTWEFELDSKSGVTSRKMDVAVHAGGRGFAVLGSAPAKRFEQVRPDIEAAINSFQLKSNSKSGRKSDDDEPGF